MKLSTSQSDEALLQVYAKPPQVFVAGEGSHLITEDGDRYLDFTSGIGVNALGYGDPDFAAAVRAALETGLVHTSNLYRTRPGEELASWLVERSFADRVFFANSGAESVEGAFKFARRWARETGSTDKYEIVAFRGSFHGRTFGSLSATDRPAYQEPFTPLMPGVRFGNVGDVDALQDLIRADRTAAVIIEPIQAEGGIKPVPTDFLRALRERCDSERVLLIFDEIQVGMGRTGTLWAHEQAGVEPDMMTLAKPLAGGLPAGAILLREEVARTIKPGDHATTFGGGPLVMTAALAVCRKLGDAGFLAEVRRKGERIGKALTDLAQRHDAIVAVRGRGMIWGVEVETPSAEVVRAAREAHLLLVAAGPNVVRILPPLTTSDDDLERGLSILAEVL